MKRFTAWINERGIHATARRRIYQGPGIYLDGSTNKRKMDVGIMACHGDGKADQNIDDLVLNWNQILVAGELKCNPVEDAQNPAWVDLATREKSPSRLPSLYTLSLFNITSLQNMALIESPNLQAKGANRHLDRPKTDLQLRRKTTSSDSSGSDSDDFNLEKKPPPSEFTRAYKRWQLHKEYETEFNKRPQGLGQKAAWLLELEKSKEREWYRGFSK
ncbi:MAG: hypothetical protein Q9187_005636 [Circinaria calcarea]